MKSFFTLLVLAISTGSMGQSQFDQRLLAKYSEERIVELRQNQPAIIEYWTYYLDHSCTIVDGEATGKTITTEEEIKINEMKNFNILKLDIHMDRNSSKAYRIKGSNKYLILKSNDQFSKEFSRNRTVKL